MQSLFRRSPGGRWAALGALGLFLSPALARADFERRVTLNASELHVLDLVGAVRVERATGSDFEVVVHVQGQDADEKWVQVETQEGARARVLVKFPVDEYRRYTYPPMGRGRSTFSFDHKNQRGGWMRELADLARGERIEVSGRSSGRALEVWADVTVRVPAGKTAGVHLGCGTIEATGVKGDLDLDTRAGDVEATEVEGDVSVDTGSGHVDVRKITGELDVDTGSGSVSVSDVKADREVKIDTGSGRVNVTGIAARTLDVDTGSGGVDLTDIDVQELVVDTGSGGVDGRNVATNELTVDTGSGGVDFELVKMGRGRYEFDTGSGGVRLDMPRDLSARFDVSTGSGSIQTDIDGVTLSRRERRAARFKVGGGDADVEVSTGSGSVRLTQNASVSSRR